MNRRDFIKGCVAVSVLGSFDWEPHIKSPSISSPSASPSVSPSLSPSMKSFNPNMDYGNSIFVRTNDLISFKTLIMGKMREDVGRVVPLKYRDKVSYIAKRYGNNGYGVCWIYQPKPKNWQEWESMDCLYLGGLGGYG